MNSLARYLRGSGDILRHVEALHRSLCGALLVGFDSNRREFWLDGIKVIRRGDGKDRKLGIDRFRQGGGIFDRPI